MLPASDASLTRLNKLLPLLSCPQCGGGLTISEMVRLDCESCAAQYPIEAGIPILLPPGVTSANTGDAALGDEVSRHPYSPKAQGIIDKCRDQWVLDLGAGGKLQRIDHVVQVDIFPYPMVDVVASADRLPFRAGVFGAVLSQAVFEHLQFPESAAREVRRVLKPGGIAKIDTAFLQPEHGYPYHFFNATESGLRHWFRDFQITWSGVEPYQHPKWALHWFAGVYLDALSSAHRQSLGGRRLEDIFATLDRVGKGNVADGDHELLSAMDALPGHVERALAAGVSVELIAPDVWPLVSSPRLRSPLVDDAPDQWRIIELERRLTEVALDRDRQLKSLSAMKEELAVSDRMARESVDAMREAWVLAQDARRLTERLALQAGHDVAGDLGFLRLVRKRAGRAFRYWVRRVGEHRSRPQRLAVGAHGEVHNSGLPAPTVVISMTPLTCQDLLYQFFSLARQTFSGWVAVIELPAGADDVFVRAANEVAALDRRVQLRNPTQAVEAATDLSERARQATWAIALDAGHFLAFDALEELVTLAQHCPRADSVTTECVLVSERQLPMRSANRLQPGTFADRGVRQMAIRIGRAIRDPRAGEQIRAAGDPPLTPRVANGREHLGKSCMRRFVVE